MPDKRTVPAWRFHAVFTDTRFEMIHAEGQPLEHTVTEQLFSDWGCRAVGGR